MKCFRVWFKDGSALCVDAEDKDAARLKALELVDDAVDLGLR